MLRKLLAVFTEVCCSSGFCDCPAAGLQSGDKQGAASPVLTWRGVCSRGGVGGSCRRAAVQQQSGVCRGGAGWRWWHGSSGLAPWLSPWLSVPCSVVCTHTRAPAAPSGRRHGRAAGGAGRQAGGRALLRPEAVVVLLFNFCKGFDCDTQEINRLHPFRSTGKLLRNHKRHSIHC